MYRLCLLYLLAAFGVASITPDASAAAAYSQERVGERIGDGIVRFHRSAEARAGALPSFSLERPRASLGDVPRDFAIRPAFSRAEGGRLETRIEIEPGTSLYGTGQVAGPLRRNGRVIETWNFDAYGYQDDARNLYTSHPWVLAVRPDGTSFGVLADTTYRVEVDLRDGIVFRAEGRDHPVIVIERDSPQGVMKALGDLTGTIAMPPIWAIGYHQCRYSYYPDERVREIAREFRERNIPCDVIWMDIDYMDGFRCFTFDADHFPDPAGLNSWLREHNFANVWMINPGIKDEDGYFVKDQGDEIDAWVRTADGAVFRGDVWPGACVFPDYFRADVREWWAGLYRDFMAHGIDGVWNDMNEPAIFNVPSKTMPEDNAHRADDDLGGEGPHARYHNVYGMMMVRASREGIMAANPDRRPFVLSRANFIGGHRYGATWTGDNTANWYHVDVSIPMTLNLGLSGQPFAGPDIGGFAGNGDAQMFSRWMGFGALLPFARGHTGKGNIDKEPWAFGPEVEATSRRALERRYRLLPLFYTLFREASVNGMPVARPTFFADPADPALRSEHGSFLLGENLLVVADLTPGRDRVVVMPRGDWREFDFPSFDGGRDSKDHDQVRLYVRPGGIVPTGPVMQHAREKPLDPVTLIIHLDERGRARGELYEDDGDGYGYRDGEYLHTVYEAERTGNIVTVRVAEQEGRMARPNRTMRVRLMLPDGSETMASGRDGEPLRLVLP